MSRITSVRLVTKTLMAPLVPAGTIAALATIWPRNEFSVDTFGCWPPACQAVRYCNGPGGTTVKFIEYAFAELGTPQAADGIAKGRVSPALNMPGPSDPDVH